MRNKSALNFQVNIQILNNILISSIMWIFVYLDVYTLYIDGNLTGIELTQGMKDGSLLDVSSRKQGRRYSIHAMCPEASRETNLSRQCGPTSTTPQAREAGLQLSSKIHKSHTSWEKHHIRTILILNQQGWHCKTVQNKTYTRF